MKTMNANELRAVNGGYKVSASKYCPGCGKTHKKTYTYWLFWQKNLWKYRAQTEVDNMVLQCVNNSWFR